MKHFIFYTILVFSALTVFSGTSYANNKEQLSDVWGHFIKVIQGEDCGTFTSLSSTKIRCPLCADADEHERLMNPNWHKDLYQKKIYIPAKNFCKSHLPAILNHDALVKLKEAKTFFVQHGSHGDYEIIVTTTKPGEFHPNHEGGQHVFQFSLVDGAYQFTGIDTIP